MLEADFCLASLLCSLICIKKVASDGSASGAIGPDAEAAYLFAPANNPFVTAQVLSDYVKRHRTRSSEEMNIYLCPVGTKPQVLGFGLYYIKECLDTPVSVLFPIALRYSRETTSGVARIWKYTVEF